jgi:hypothetical protein
VTPALAIRFAMLTGVLVFGGVVFFARRSGTAPGMPEESQRMLLLMGRFLWVAAIAGCVFVYQAAGRARAGRASQLHIVGWALGESVALFGAVVWFLTGTPAWYVPGLTFLVLSFLVFRPAADGRT